MGTRKSPTIRQGFPWDYKEEMKQKEYKLAELGVICGLLPTASREREFVEQFGTVNPCPRFADEIRSARQDK